MSGSISQALEAWRDGNDNAQFDLVHGLQPFLLELVRQIRQRRNERLRPRIDSEAVVYEALKSFLTGLQKMEFPQVKNREDVRKLLTILVLRTLIGQVRWNMAKKRSPLLEQPCNKGRLDDLAQPAATLPAEFFLSKWLDEFGEALRSTHEKAITIVDLTFKGLSNNDIAGEIDLSLRTVQLIKKRTHSLLCEKFRWEED